MSQSERVSTLLKTMTVDEKIAQLYGVWLGYTEGGVVAPEMDTSADSAPEFGDIAANGISQLTRVFGTKPVLPAKGLATLIGYQKWIRDHTRLRIGILAHEECLTGLAAWTATTFPTPLAWAATFDPGLTYEMGAAIGQSMAAIGVHQGLAPVLDVVRDARWGRVEETMGEDPYVIATLGKGYVEGLQSQGIIATLKHYAGYSNSRAGRNLAPVHAGPREIEDVFLPPFEVAVLDAHVRSVMPAYVEIDGIPVHADHHLLTEVLRERWGFEGTVVSDYFGVAFLMKEHGIASTLDQAAVASLVAGLDVELPTGDAFRAPGFAQAAAEDPIVAQALDTAVERVLNQKEALGLLDIDAEIERLERLLADVPETLDPPAHRDVASRLAAESIILLDNDGLLPVAPRAGLRVAVVGPNADRGAALFGCYSFVNHVLMHNPGVDPVIAAPTIMEAITAEYPDAIVTYAQGCTVRDMDTSGIPEAVAAAASADVVVAVVGDQAGLFGKGTSGEGCDVDSLELPGVQSELLEALLATGTPLVLVPVTGRPYAIGRFSDRAAATIQAFFPGEEGGAALAGVISGRINPSGHLPVSVPRTLGVLPYSYLHPKLGDPSGVSSIDTTPQFSFGHGQSYTSFDYTDFTAPKQVPTNGWIEASVTVNNTGDRDGTTLVQVYGRDLAASVTRPLRQLLAYARVEVAAGGSRPVTLRIPAARFGFHDASMRRVVEPGDVQVWIGWDCDHAATPIAEVGLTGPTAPITNDTPRLAEVVFD
ncbi:MAG: glycoside hydrolase family 3 C-terminal domain-containing protein [Propionibacteriaceae bacterium]|jgi:beta-glucosidase|nr:glycoside hydrolase family 3 C-terminal domain-containing protein [Propionibacteriaceae bacterium]